MWSFLDVFITLRSTATHRDIFYSPADRKSYLGLLQHYANCYQLQVLAYCLVSSYVHLLVVPPDTQALAHTLREVHGRYARYLNALEASSGHLWQGRYCSCLVEEAGLGEVMRYVEIA